MHRVLLPFEFAEPTTVRGALALIDGERTRALAGGVDLVLRMRLRQVLPEKVVSLQKLPDLDYVRADDLGLAFGALASLRQLEASRAVREGWPLLAEAIGSIGSVQVKVQGTAVGNLCVGTPASDVAPALHALGARVRLTGLAGEREIPIEELFLDVGKTAVRPHELVTEIVVPPPPAGSGAAFMKLAKTSEDIAKVNVAVMVSVGDGAYADVSIALGSVAPTPLRAVEAESLLRMAPVGEAAGFENPAGAAAANRVSPALEATGNPVSPGLEAAAQAAAQAAVPISDVRSTASYRKEMVRVLVKDALARATARAVAGRSDVQAPGGVS